MRAAHPTANNLAHLAKVRLDTLLHDRGLFESRSRAAASVMAGEVRVGTERRTAEKPGMLVTADVAVDVAQRPRYVSRGGIKLENALDRLGIGVAGRNCLDVGASTGGFTDCLLQRGAGHVVALDVAYGQLSWALRGDPRVTVVERVNARSLRPEALPYAPHVVVADLSFISLVKILPAVRAVVADRFDSLLMVKPQFEVGRERVGSGGVVRDPGARRDALLSVARAAEGLAVMGFASSGLPGPKGNRETFIWLAEPGRSGALDRSAVERAALEIEP